MLAGVKVARTCELRAVPVNSSRFSRFVAFRKQLYIYQYIRRRLERNHCRFHARDAGKFHRRWGPRG